MTGKLLEIWCWVCHNRTKHEMVTYEKGYCTICKNANYILLDDID